MNNPEVMSVFGRAVEIAAPRDRAVFLDEVCAGRPDVRSEVEGLLNAHGNAGSFMACPAAPAAETSPLDSSAAEGVGSSVGPSSTLPLQMARLAFKIRKRVDGPRTAAARG